MKSERVKDFGIGLCLFDYGGQDCDQLNGFVDKIGQLVHLSGVQLVQLEVQIGPRLKN